jgi:DNA-binding NarL/FixJ family response regulator
VSEGSHEENGSPTKVLVVDDHSVTRHGVVLLCKAAEGVEVIGEAADGNEAIARVTELLPDVVLMDVDMPRRDGISATKQIRHDHPSVGVVVLTVHEDQETIFEAIKAGASGYLPKSATLDDIRSAVKAVAAGGSFLDPVQARKLLHQFNRYADETKAAADIYYLLTGREREILALLAEGLTSATSTASSTSTTGWTRCGRPCASGWSSRLGSPHHGACPGFDALPSICAELGTCAQQIGAWGRRT